MKLTFEVVLIVANLMGLMLTFKKNGALKLC